MRFVRRRAALALTLASAVLPLGRYQEVGRASALAREFERLAERDLWPGFEPLSIPLAIYDGKRTYLFRHPAPPVEFARVEGAAPPAFGREGRHPALVANSSADIGGVSTATVLIDERPKDETLTEIAAMAIHETFHVFQRRRHPTWQANEADLFVYPTDDEGLLALRRLESAALARALAAEDPAAAARWTRKALGLRSERYSKLAPEFPAYERATELNEGLATYVQDQAAGSRQVELPPQEFGADEVRHRAYATGAALAHLLDRCAPSWKESFEEDDAQLLDAALAKAVGEGDASVFTAVEEDQARRAASQAVAALREQRAAKRAAFEGRPGPRVELAVEGEPLWPQQFDPLNVAVVEGGVLHTRLLQLGNARGKLEAIGTEALTEGVGPHPILNGVRRVKLTGLRDLSVEVAGDRVALRARGVSLEFEGAVLRRDGDAVEVRVGAKK